MRIKEYCCFALCPPTWHTDEPSEIGWYNARERGPLGRPMLGENTWNDYENLYFQNCNDSTWRYWDGNYWSVEFLQSMKKRTVKKRWKQHRENRHFAGSIAYTLRYPFTFKLGKNHGNSSF